MKALMKVREGRGHVELREVPEPALKPNMVKIAVKFAGICGTDQHILHGTYACNPPVVLGHEISGVVAETGGDVKSVKPGDRVTVLPSTGVTCGRCEHCRTGNYMFCPERKSIGSGIDGGFAKVVAVREDMVYKIPDHLSLEEAALTEPLACAVKAIEELVHIRVGDTVLLSGPGPIGLLCLSLLLVKGCRVIVAGAAQDAGRLKIAADMGAHVIVDVSEQDLQEIVDRETGGRGVDVAVECAGAEGSVANCLRAVKKRGKYIQVGIIGREIRVAFDTILYKQLQVAAPYAHAIETFDRVMRIWEHRLVNVKPIITHRVPLSRWEEAFRICEEKTGGKVLLVCDE